MTTTSEIVEMAGIEPGPTTYKKIGMTYGLNRLRGKSEGVLFSNDARGDSLEEVRNMLRAEAELKGFAASAEWLSQGVSCILNLYGRGLAEWEMNKGDTVGFVYEMSLPSGVGLLLGDRRVLDKVSMAHCG